MEEVSFPGTIVKSDEKGVAKIWIDEPYDEIVRGFAKENKIKPGTKIRVVFMPWENNCSEQAFNLFHALRDRLAEASEDTSREYKEHLKNCLKFDFGIKKELIPGSNTWWLKSTTRYTVKEMNALIDGTITRCLEEKASIPDYLEEFNQLKAEQGVK